MIAIFYFLYQNYRRSWTEWCLKKIRAKMRNFYAKVDFWKIRFYKSHFKIKLCPRRTNKNKRQMNRFSNKLKMIKEKIILSMEFSNQELICIHLLIGNFHLMKKVSIKDIILNQLAALPSLVLIIHLNESLHFYS